ncbi:MAG TPA: DinB family protein [Pyrinomonadaceae bacterium]|nr:DinB family protein [Pyrinomonadaceae bacterium]
MEDVIEDFVRTVEDASARLLAMSDGQTAARGEEGDWSAKEILGHLVDSAANNHQRFVRGQFSEDLVFPGYKQDDWVRAQAYADEPWPLVVNLWKFYNLHLAHVMRHAPEEVRSRPRLRHNFHVIGFAPVNADEPSTLEHLMRDYVAHLKHHLRQIFGGE